MARCSSGVASHVIICAACRDLDEVTLTKLVPVAGGADETVRLWSLEHGTAAGAAGSSKLSKAAVLQAMSVYRTKSTPVTHVQFSSRNLLLGAGSFTLRNS